MSVSIDPSAKYHIRSRGVRRAAVDGSQLEQLVRGLTLARHDELSEDGVTWFAAGLVESLFPSSPSTPRLIRNRQTFDEQDAPAAPVQSMVTEAESLSFSRDPWFVARGSNVAGPYDNFTIATWYREGRLQDNDQLRPGMNASWVSLGEANRNGMLPSETAIRTAPRKHIVADPPVWMGPAQSFAARQPFSSGPQLPSTIAVERSGVDIVTVMFGLAAISVGTMLVGIGIAIWTFAE